MEPLLEGKHGVLMVLHDGDLDCVADGANILLLPLERVSFRVGSK